MTFEFDLTEDIINLSYTYRTLLDPIGHCSPEVAHSRFWSMCQQEAINAFNRHKPFFFFFHIFIVTLFAAEMILLLLTQQVWWLVQLQVGAVADTGG